MSFYEPGRQSIFLFTITIPIQHQNPRLYIIYGLKMLSVYTTTHVPQNLSNIFPVLGSSNCQQLHMDLVLFIRSLVTTPGKTAVLHLGKGGRGRMNLSAQPSQHKCGNVDVTALQVITNRMFIIFSPWKHKNWCTHTICHTVTPISANASHFRFGDHIQFFWVGVTHMDQSILV